MPTIPFCYLPHYHAHHSVLLSPIVPCSPLRLVSPTLPCSPSRSISHNTMPTIPFCYLPQYHAHHFVLLYPTVPRSPFRFVVSHITMLTIPFVVSFSITLTIPFCYLPQYYAHYSVLLPPTIPCPPFSFVVSHSTMLTIPFCCLPHYHAHHPVCRLLQYHANHAVLLSPTIPWSPFRFTFPVLCSTNQAMKIRFSFLIMSSRKSASLRRDNILTYFDFFVFKCVSAWVCVFVFKKYFSNFSQNFVVNQKIDLRHWSHQISAFPKFPIHFPAILSLSLT